MEFHERKMWGDKNIALLKKTFAIEEKEFRPNNAKPCMVPVPFLETTAGTSSKSRSDLY